MYVSKCITDERQIRCNLSTNIHRLCIMVDVQLIRDIFYYVGGCITDKRQITYACL